MGPTEHTSNNIREKEANTQVKAPGALKQSDMLPHYKKKKKKEKKEHSTLKFRGDSSNKLVAGIIGEDR